MNVLDWSKILPLVENDFEPAVFAKHPVLAQIKQQLLSQGAEVALLSGSGATMFGSFLIRSALSGRRQSWLVIKTYGPCRASRRRTCDPCGQGRVDGPG